jgi:hypothetical protein
MKTGNFGFPLQARRKKLRYCTQPQQATVAGPQAIEPLDHERAPAVEFPYLCPRGGQSETRR